MVVSGPTTVPDHELRHPARRQPGRDRRPDHPHRPRTGPAHGRGVLRRRPGAAARPARRRGGTARPGAREGVVPRRGPDPARPPRTPARARSTPATASCPRTRPSPARGEAAGHRVRRARRPSSWSCSAPSTPRARRRRAAGVPLLAGHRACWRRSTRRVAGRGAIGYPVMLKATGGAAASACRRAARADELTEAWERVRADRRRLLLLGRRLPGAARRRPPATSRCRSSATARAASSPSATATARSSAATRRSSRRRPAPGLPDDVRAADRAAARDLCAVGRATAPPEPSSSSTTPRARRPRSWRSTPGSRSSTRSPRRSTASTSSPGCSAWPAATRPSSTTPLQPARPRRRGPRLRRGPRPRTPPERGPVDRVEFPPDVRVDRWVETGHRGDDRLRPAARQGDRVRRRPRRRAWAALDEALAGTRVDGIETNLGLLRAVVRDPEVRGGAALHGHPRDRARPDPAHRGRLAAGTLTTVQDWPGRTGLLAGRRPAVRPDGRPVVPPRQPGARQPRGRPRPGVHAPGPDAALQPPPRRSA